MMKKQNAKIDLDGYIKPSDLQYEKASEEYRHLDWTFVQFATLYAGIMVAGFAKLPLLHEYREAVIAGIILMAFCLIGVFVRNRKLINRRMIIIYAYEQEIGLTVDKEIYKRAENVDQAPWKSSILIDIMAFMGRARTSTYLLVFCLLLSIIFAFAVWEYTPVNNL